MTELVPTGLRVFGILFLVIIITSFYTNDWSAWMFIASFVYIAIGGSSLLMLLAEIIAWIKEKKVKE